MWHICMLGRGNILNVSSETEQIHKVKSLTPKDEKTGPTSCIMHHVSTFAISHP